MVMFIIIIISSSSSRSSISSSISSIIYRSRLSLREGEADAGGRLEVVQAGPQADRPEPREDVLYIYIYIYIHIVI